MDTVILARDEYERLVAASEDLADLIAYDCAMASRVEGMPHDVLKSIIAGANPIRAVREWRAITSAELARRAGMNRVHLHQMETGMKHGSVDTMKRLAMALDVPLDDLV